MREIRADGSLWLRNGLGCPIAGLSDSTVFFRMIGMRGGIVYAVSRSALERKGKAYDRERKIWLFADRGDALASGAKDRQKRKDKQTRQEASPQIAGLPSQKPTDADLIRLKLAMAAAHPDRGGSNEAFIRAHKRWTDAKNMIGR